ncbi:hypothetical protein VPH35_006990 [Triticum aestivum]
MAEICNLPAANVVSSQGSSYVIKIDEYSRIKGQSERGKYVKSTPFSVGGHDWVVWYFPNEPVGSYNKTAEHIFPSKGSDWDSLRIMCDVTVVKYGHKANRLSLVPPSNLHQHLGELLKSRDGADVTFHVGGESFLAHRAVLAARSSVFKAELFGAMKEDADRPTEISDMEPDVFRSLLHFIYTDSPPIRLMTNGGKARRDAVMAGHLLVVADRYYIERLKVFCEEKLCKLLDSDIVATSLALAEQHKSRRLKEACFQFLASLSNLKAMMASDGYEHLKNSCPSVLKELAVSFLPAELKAVKDHCILSILVSISSTIATAKVPISYFFCNIEEIFPDFFI